MFKLLARNQNQMCSLNAPIDIRQLLQQKNNQGHA